MVTKIQMSAGVIKEAFQYESALVAFAYGMLRDWALAKDAVQDAFVVFIEKYAQEAPKPGMFPLMKKIVHFKVLEILRIRRREVLVGDEELGRLVGDVLEDAVSEEEAMRHNLRLCALHDCMAMLTDALKELLIAFYWKRQSCEELARITGRAAPSLRVTLMRARDALRECMEKRLRNDEVAP